MEASTHRALIYGSPKPEPHPLAQSLAFRAARPSEPVPIRQPLQPDETVEDDEDELENSVPENLGGFANLRRSFSPVPQPRTDEERELDMAWARVTAEKPVPVLGVPDREHSRSAPPMLLDITPSGSHTRSHTADSEAKQSDVGSEASVPFITVGSTPALSSGSRVGGTSSDDESSDDEEDVPLPSRFGQVLSRAYSPAPVPKTDISPPPESYQARDSLAPPGVSSPILLAAIQRYEASHDQRPTAVHSRVIDHNGPVDLSPLHITSPVVVPQPQKPWSGQTSPETSSNPTFGMTQAAATSATSQTIDIDALETAAERSPTASRPMSRRPTMASRRQSDEVVLGLQAQFAKAREALERANASGRRYSGNAWTPVLTPDAL